MVIMVAQLCSLPIFCTVLLTLVLGKSHALTEECGLNAELNITVTSRRNLTGHWITSIETERIEPARTSKEIIINVAQRTSSCQGLDTYKLTGTATGHAFRPPSDYELVDELYYYKLPPVAVPWHDARKTCEKDGGHLLIINSKDEAQTVERYRERYSKLPGIKFVHSTWVGISDEEKEGEYITTLGQPLANTGYTKWHSGSLPPGTSYNCMYYSNYGGETGLANYNCKDTLNFICEFDVLRL